MTMPNVLVTEFISYPIQQQMTGAFAAPQSHSNKFSSASTPFPTPQISPTTSLATTTELHLTHTAAQWSSQVVAQHHTRHVLQVTPPPGHVPMSPSCSVATQTAEMLLADWTEDGESKAPTSTSSPTASSKEEATVATSPEQCTVGTETHCLADEILEGTIAVIMTLVLKGDQHWEMSNPRRCKTTGAKTNIQHTVSGLICDLRASGLLRDEVAISMVVYLRRLSAKHIKYVSRFTIKKYLIAACMVANKTCSDEYYCLDDYVTVVGTTKDSIIQGEIQFLTNIDYDVQMGLHHGNEVQEGKVIISFFQTSVLIHDMATAAAAAIVSAEVEADTTTTLEGISSETPVATGLATATTSIIAIVEGILANAEARM